jgi:hypothetical protein
MPYTVELIHDTEKDWPPRIQNTFSEFITTEEVIESIQESVKILDKQSTPIDVIAVFEKGSSMLGAKGILFQGRLIDQFTWHPKLDQIVAVELNRGLYGSFIKTLLQAAKSRPGLKVTVFGTLAELDKYLNVKYSPKVEVV